MRYSTLLRLLVKHPYYADGRCPDFALEPSVETRRLLRDHRSILKVGDSELRVLASIEPPLPLAQDAVLRFHLRLRRRDFEVFTKLTDFDRQRALFVNNDRDHPEIMSLDVGPQRLAPGVFADVEIHLSGLQPPAELRITFEAKASRWVYYITDAAHMDQVELTDEDGNLAFNRLATSTSSDRVAQGLLRQQPERSLVRFISGQTVECSQVPVKKLKLSSGSSHEWPHLPNPSICNWTRLAVTDGENPSTLDVLFQIVDLSTQSIGTSGG